MIASRPLRWALAATLLSSAGVALLPDDEVAPPTRASAAPAAGPVPATRQAAAAVDPGPKTWPRVVLRNAPPPLPRLRPEALAAWGDARPPALAPTAAAAASAPPPEPPPPWTLIGLVEEGGSVSALLLEGPNTRLVRAGDALDGRWRVEAIAGRRVTLARSDGSARHVLNFKPT
ncbi:conserved exported hypothetical protein [Rubrivivax sp. A210]|uniref:hypothetical protein n=1 Tax=Rubrivivax sp. A210 TaxID=2772301 RepID=UPI0019192006|nr:hypothetical protein [Rubrivivax sp. A210]CAD5373514.1 conserved exported hypothetical protein [Rubrivivax sp. A210]